MKLKFLSILVLCSLTIQSEAQDYKFLNEPATGITAINGIEKPVTVKVICDNLFTSGEFNYQIAEQALILNTKNGLVVMTGCSHPGIVEMLKVIKTSFNKNIYGIRRISPSAKKR